jgi:hypothetical protein
MSRGFMNGKPLQPPGSVCGDYRNTNKRIPLEGFCPLVTPAKAAIQKEGFIHAFAPA